MSQATDNNKRIAKNTLLLYIRMLFMMIVSLYTSRVILDALGVEDFGIYNVVGGVVAMFSVISGSLSASISRFITFELGKGDQSKLNKIFSASVTIQILLSLIVVILIEIVGVWFLNSKMIIPADRILAANWVLQFSVVTFVINLISVPYNASIIAHEKMSAFAYISILEAIGKLIIAYLIVIAPMDKLVFYSILMCSVAIIIRFTYGYYCKRHFKECTYHFCWDKKLLKNMFGFAGWNFIGAASSVLRDQGGNVVINLFFGPSVNAAKGIAMQVNSAISGFVSNFMTALNPQIIKSYAAQDKNYLKSLLFRGSRYSFFLLYILSLPIIIETDTILTLWLGHIPEHALIFVRLMLFLALTDAISYPLITAILATGDIKRYSLLAGGFNLLNFPLSYLFLYLGNPPECTVIIAIIISVGCLVIRLIILNEKLGISFNQYLKKVLLNVIITGIISSIIPLILYHEIMQPIVRLIVVILGSLVSSLFVIYWIGCTSNERNFVKMKASQFINRFRK